MSDPADPEIPTRHIRGLSDADTAALFERTRRPADTLAAASASRNAILAELERRKGGRFQTIFPIDGPFRRELYPKHI